MASRKETLLRKNSLYAKKRRQFEGEGHTGGEEEEKPTKCRGGGPVGRGGL